MSAPLEAHALGKRLRRGWALRDCTLTVPEHAVVGLAGRNAAGKSTLLELATGLVAPTEGSIAVFGRDPRRDAAALADVGYVAQGAPLYLSFRVEETIRYACATNARWDATIVGGFLEGLDPRTRVAELSAGDRARLALAIALGKRPSLLLLDEPFARLDPLAGREFLQLLMEGVAATGATVVVASHVTADLERVCDHIVLLADGHVRLQGGVEELLDTHRLLVGARRPMGRIRGVSEIVRERHSGRQSTLLVRADSPIADASWTVSRVQLEELLLAYLAPDSVPPVPQASPDRVPLRWHG